MIKLSRLSSDHIAKIYFLFKCSRFNFQGSKIIGSEKLPLKNKNSAFPDYDPLFVLFEDFFERKHKKTSPLNHRWGGCATGSTYPKRPFTGYVS